MEIRIGECPHISIAVSRFCVQVYGLAKYIVLACTGVHMEEIIWNCQIIINNGIMYYGEDLTVYIWNSIKLLCDEIYY